MKKVEGRLFYKPGSPGPWNPVDGVVPDGKSDWKVVYAFDFLEGGREFKLRASHEIRSKKTSIDVGANVGVSRNVCGGEFLKVRLAQRFGDGSITMFALGLEATLLKPAKFQYPIFPPSASAAGQ